MIDISVVVCTHNPRPLYLSRVLAALRSQTLPMEQWELLLVDNASSPVLANRIDLSWHPAGRHVREEELGLTPARLRGIAEAKGDVLVFVDDDNVLSETYLAAAIAVGEAFPFLGAWGGSIGLEFETPPTTWVLQYRSHLAHREFNSPRWSNIKSDIESQPYGAGMCLRRKLCQGYSQKIMRDEFRRSLDRKGANLLAGGDLDLVLTSAEYELGWGNFPTLMLTHLIPSARTDESYLLRLREEVTLSNYIIADISGFAPPLEPQWKFAIQLIWRRLRFGRHVARFMAAERRGRIRGRKAANEYAQSHQFRSVSGAFLKEPCG